MIAAMSAITPAPNSTAARPVKVEDFINTPRFSSLHLGAN
jgi:hypothetical protein